MRRSETIARKISYKEALEKYERAQRSREESISRAERRRRRKMEKLNRFLDMLRFRGGYYEEKKKGKNRR